MTENRVSSKPTKKRNEIHLDKDHNENQPNTKKSPDTAINKATKKKSHVGRGGTG